MELIETDVLISRRCVQLDGHVHEPKADRTRPHRAWHIILLAAAPLSFVHPTTVKFANPLPGTLRLIPDNAHPRPERNAALQSPTCTDHRPAFGRSFARTQTRRPRCV